MKDMAGSPEEDFIDLIFWVSALWKCARSCVIIPRTKEQWCAGEKANQTIYLRETRPINSFILPSHDSLYLMAPQHTLNLHICTLILHENSYITQFSLCLHAWVIVIEMICVKWLCSSVVLCCITQSQTFGIQYESYFIHSFEQAYCII